MNAVSRLIAPLCLVSLWGCSNSMGWDDKLQQLPLHDWVRQAEFASGCRFPMEYGRTLPIPKPPSDFVIQYYPVARDHPSKPWTVFTPVFSQELSAKDGKAAACKSMGRPEDSRPLGKFTPLEDKVSARQTYTLWNALDRISVLYFSRAHLSPEDSRMAVNLVEEFQKQAEPGFLPIYYKMNPDFWEWLRNESGSSIPKS